MPQLLSFRKGWESENLARYLLHKFSFIANPASISDDIGSDYFCTIFDIQKEGSHDYLIPTNSFAVQIKSTAESIDVTEKIPYLHRLELPYFIGVVDKTKLSLTFYSGEFIPPLFSYVGIPKYLEINLCEQSDFSHREFLNKIENEKYRINFPFVAKIDANQNNEEFRVCVNKIQSRCDMMYRNIVSKRKEEYIFKYLPNGDGFTRVLSFAGVGSIKHFRNNLIERLGEAFNNLAWLLHSDRTRFNMEELKIYKGFYVQIKANEAIFGKIPDYIEEYFQLINDMANRIH